MLAASDHAVVIPTFSPRRIFMSLVEHHAERDLISLVHRARAGEAVAWTRLVDRFDGMIRGIARGHRLTSIDVEDVSQTTWLRCHENLDRLREAGAIGAWLATTARRESLRLRQIHVNEVLSDDPELGEGVDRNRPETELIASEQRVVLRRALDSLPQRQRRLMTLLADQPSADYGQISATLVMPVGSIGPTRARSLARLEHHPELRELHMES
jgi:RNA polymerase sigma factor (sigma-70 family)